MKYSISRDGQAIGTHTQEELGPLVNIGQLLATDQARADGSETDTTIAQLLMPAPAEPPPIALPPPAPPVDAFLVRRGREQFGPYPFLDLHRHALAGHFLPTDVAWCPGMPAWELLPQVLHRRGVVLPPPPKPQTDESLKWVLPIGRSGLAIAAGYLGIFSILFFPAPIALVVGILALRDLKKNPTKGGIGRAWLGVIAGALGTIALIVGLVALALAPRPA